MKRFWFGLTLAVVLATYLPQVRAPFELQDDHRIIAPVVKPHSGAVRMYIAELRSDFEHVGRFRPVNQIFDVIGPVVLGPRPFVWHALSVLLATAVAALLFFVGNRVFNSPAAGAVFALVTLLAPDPGPTAAWYRLGPKEAWGMLLLSGALAMMVLGRSERVTLLLVAMTAYSKESFLLLVPALLGVRIWLEARTSGVTITAALYRLRGVAIAYAALFVIGMTALFMAAKSAGVQSYGGHSLATSPTKIVSVLFGDILRAPALAVWFIPVVLVLFIARPTLFELSLFLAWVVPQYVLHATRGGFWDHYWLPCVVAFAAANAVASAVLPGRVPLFRLALAVFVLWTINAVRIDAFAVWNHTEKARVQQEAVRIAAEQVAPESDLLIVGEPGYHSETAPSFADFVRFRGGHYRRALLVNSRSKSISSSDAGVIVYLAEPPGAEPVRSGYIRRDVRGQYQYLSLRKGGCVTKPFHLRVDVRRPGV